MNNIEPGCKALVIRSLCQENVGKIVKVGRCLGVIFPDCEPDKLYWEVDQYMLCINGNYVKHSAHRNLQRIDDNKELETIKTEEEISV